jgi:hypothetical protein
MKLQLFQNISWSKYFSYCLCFTTTSPSWEADDIHSGRSRISPPLIKSESLLLGLPYSQNFTCHRHQPGKSSPLNYSYHPPICTYFCNVASVLHVSKYKVVWISNVTLITYHEEGKLSSSLFHSLLILSLLCFSYAQMFSSVWGSEVSWNTKFRILIKFK